MKINIDELNTRYLIPGLEIGPAAADPEGFEEDYSVAPYSQMSSVGDLPSPTGWQDLLGLNQMSPSPSQIDPPPRPASLGNRATAGETGGSLPFPGSTSRNGAGVASASPKFDRMLGILATYDQAARRIRVRRDMVAALKQRASMSHYGLVSEPPNSTFYERDGYWRGPIWAPSTMLIATGLREVGENQFSESLEEQFCQMARRSSMAPAWNQLKKKYDTRELGLQRPGRRLGAELLGI